MEENIEPNDETSEEELAKLIQQNNQIRESLRNELDEYLDEIHNNINIFTTWAKASINNKNYTKEFIKDFVDTYRSQLFDQICHFFLDENMVTDEVLFYWKYLVVSLLENSKKYKSYLNRLEYDKENKKTNLRMVREKSIFRCFIDEEPICYFKDNGNEYYVS